MGLTEYTIERTYAVSAMRLFEGFTDPELLKQWVWGSQAIDVQIEQELRVNGTFNVSMAIGDDRWGMRGIYLEIQPGRKLTHTLHWDADVGYNREGMDPMDEVVIVSISSDGSGCRLEYTHMGIPDIRSANEHERSVRLTLDLLENVLG